MKSNLPTMTLNPTPKIQEALKALTNGNFTQKALKLLNTMGYQSERTRELSGQTDDFITQFPAKNKDTQTEKELLKHTETIHLLFQLTSEEIEHAAHKQITAFDTHALDQSNAQSFLFFAVTLNHNHYSRTQYATFTREINKRLAMPTFILFRTANCQHCTLAFVYRRPHKHKPERDVLGNVSLISEINLHNPHRAHLDILEELSLHNRLMWITKNKEQPHFDSLLSAMLDTLDTEALNRRFYSELFAWFEWAKTTATFPSNQPKTLTPEEHLIRLITRLLLVWFIKEKGLVAEELFNLSEVDGLLKDHDRENGDSYYRVVLQNLFFATLNTEIKKRRFSKKSHKTHRDFSCYRYYSEMADPDKLEALFGNTPFINSGLFDCLDSFEGEKEQGYRIDFFTDNPNQREGYTIPDRLFFEENKGLIPLFNYYKFTVEENTPTEKEVALDPELLGKVFENLLAAYNPETRETARKQTGSYYTPRPVVEYMATEALTAYLTKHAERERLQYLLDYTDALDDETLFTDDEKQAIVRAIAEIKILDPAVGSGAFPMEILHKLTLALRRLDPDNTLWESIQKQRATKKAERAFDTKDRKERLAELTEINETFERYRDSDFGRKLYLIQNSIFGVDIQSVACQIAKLRFFISLVIEQTPTDERDDNYGIKPLPNLETRFAIANTLLGLEKQMSLGGTEVIRELEYRLKANRERHFHAQIRPMKLALREEDKRLRKNLAQQLKDTGFSTDAANKIALWDPYDQNTAADWFDAEYMFGETDGFDIIIGNPPYIQLRKEGGKLGTLYQDAGYQTFVRNGDIYQLFIEQGCNLLTPQKGILTYITSNSWRHTEYGKTTRRYFAEHHTPLRLLEMGEGVFENATVDVAILLLQHGKSNIPGTAIDMNTLHDKQFPPEENLWAPLRTPPEKPWIILPPTGYEVIEKMETIGTPLKEWDVKINMGILTGYNQAFIIDDVTRQELIDTDPHSTDIIKPILRGRDIQRHQVQWAGKWLIDTHNGYGDIPAVNVDNYPAIKSYLDEFYPQLKKRSDKVITPYNLRQCTYHEEFSKEKLLWTDISKKGRFAYDINEIYGDASSFIMTGQSIKYLCAVLNTHLIHWFLQQMSPTLGMAIRWRKYTVKKIPIPQIPAEQQRPFITLVDKILKAKATNPKADTTNLEAQIDQLVYNLYELTEEEINFVEK